MSDTTHTPSRSVKVRSITSALIGNYMEFFDFGVYGFLAIVLGQVFFPEGDPTIQLLSSLAVFGVAFVFRPIGGTIFGYIGDRYGRKNSLSISIIVMSLSTAAIGFLPSFATAGLLAPVLLVALRSIQGLSVGGEFIAGSAYIAETVDQTKRGRWVSLMSVTAALGTITGSLFVLVLTTTMPTDALTTWGWRIPFWIALPIGFVGLYMRLKLEDTPVFQQIKELDSPAETSPLRSFSRADVGRMLLAVVFAGTTGLAFYYFTGYLNTYLSATVGIPREQAILISAGSIFFYALLNPLVGMLSDRIGRRPTFLIGMFTMAAFAIPAFMLMNLGANFAFIALLVYGIFMAFLNVMNAIVSVELFTAKNRMTAGSIAYNVGVGLISGSGPLIAAALVAGTGNPLAPGFYLASVCIVAAIILTIFLPETSKRSMFLTTEKNREPDSRRPAARTQ